MIKFVNLQMVDCGLARLMQREVTMCSIAYTTPALEWLEDGPNGLVVAYKRLAPIHLLIWVRANDIQQVFVAGICSKLAITEVCTCIQQQCLIGLLRDQKHQELAHLFDKPCFWELLVVQDEEEIGRGWIPKLQTYDFESKLMPAIYPQGDQKNQELAHLFDKTYFLGLLAVQ
ncbi:hypothetical protein SUGI_0649570, partial [Cryptomeria japonica]